MVVSAITISPSDAAWLACAIEGEGYLNTYRRLKPTERHPNFSYNEPQLGITNTSIEFIRKAKALYPPFYIRTAKYKKADGYGDVYYAHLTARQPIYDLLQLILPHMIIPRKINAAKEIMRYIEERKAAGGRRRVARTHCPRGHELVEGNLVADVWLKRGWKKCLVCRRLYVRGWNAKRNPIQLYKEVSEGRRW